MEVTYEYEQKYILKNGETSTFIKKVKYVPKRQKVSLNKETIEEITQKYRMGVSKKRLSGDYKITVQQLNKLLADPSTNMNQTITNNN